MKNGYGNYIQLGSGRHLEEDNVYSVSELLWDSSSVLVQRATFRGKQMLAQYNLMQRPKGIFGLRPSTCSKLPHPAPS